MKKEFCACRELNTGDELKKGTKYALVGTIVILIIYVITDLAVARWERDTATVPGVPTNLQAVPGDGSVFLKWNASSSDGGAPIYYYVIYMDGRAIRNSAVTSDTISRLVNDQPHSFYVRALNIIGLSEKSNSVMVMPAKTPDLHF
jgi:hypothetical protein